MELTHTENKMSIDILNFGFFNLKNKGYRENFTIENYRMLFQRESSAYRDDVCRGVKRIRDGMWVNGEEVYLVFEEGTNKDWVYYMLV